MSPTSWQTAPLGRLLRRNEQTIPIDPTGEYREVTVRLWGKGVVLRGIVSGSSMAADHRVQVSTNQFIISKIDARNGAMGLVPPELHGAVVSNDFPSFEPDDALLLPEYLGWLSRTKPFVEECRRASEGTTNRVRLKEERFNAIEIRFPPIDEQRRIVSRVEYFADKVRVLSQLRATTDERRGALIAAVTSEICDSLANCAKEQIGRLGPNGDNPVQTGPFGAQLHRSEFTDDGVPVLNVGNVWPEGLRLDYVDHVSPEKAIQLSRYAIKTDDLLFARSGATLGKVCVVPQNCDGWLMTGHLFRVRFDQNRCLPAFAFAVLRGSRNARDQIFGQVRGATRPGFNTTLLSRVEIPLPSLEQQRLIIARLEQLSASLDQVRNLHKRTSAEFDALLPSILDRAFAGDL